jgi:hypothetical protein
MRHRHHHSRLHSCVIALLATACGGTSDATSADERPGTPGPFVDTASPAGDFSQTPRFSEGAYGPLISWQVEPPETTGPARLEFAELRDEGWTTPRTVVKRSDLFVNWADFPSVVSLGSGRLAAHWLQYNGPGTYAYQVRMAFSDDGGTTWSEPFIPHERATQTEHGFVSLVPATVGVDVFWLDGREYEGGSEEMSFRHARVLPPGSPGGAAASGTSRTPASAAVDSTVGETVLDPRTCDCCQTDVARVGEDLVAVYRGRSDTEIRDVQVVRRVDGRWGAPRAVHDDGWRIDACPVNGPAVAAFAIS